MGIQYEQVNMKPLEGVAIRSPEQSGDKPVTPPDLPQDSDRAVTREMNWTTCRSVCGILTEHHYLGPINRGVAWRDQFGAIVISAPIARRLPGHWLELVRWCLIRGVKNDGSQQWAAFVRALRKIRPDVTTIVSYSDPSQGHTGALYRACNWWWAPTWHRLRPPPSGNGAWSEGKQESVKDRWIFPLAPDAARPIILRAQDDAILRRWPWAEYREPGGVPFKKFIESGKQRCGRPSWASNQTT